MNLVLAIFIQISYSNPKEFKESLIIQVTKIMQRPENILKLSAIKFICNLLVDQNII